MEVKDINQDYLYQGYIWLSDQKEPLVFSGDNPLKEVLKVKGVDICNMQNQFIAEGFLYCEDQKLSITIKYFDGNCWVNSYQDVDKNKISSSIILKTYLSNRMGNRKLKFLEYWEPAQDLLCEGLPVLKPTKYVFVGF